MRDGSSLDAVELPHALGGRTIQASSWQTDTQPCVSWPKLARAHVRRCIAVARSLYCEQRTHEPL